jgi:oligopeptide/dipeptide ABC transporter ATP-binding protein
MDLIKVNNLSLCFPIQNGTVQILDGLNLKIGQNESLCLVGESGCGKSMTALAIAGLLPRNSLINGKISLKGKALLTAGKDEIRRIRGREIAMIFEQPTTCLNPVFTIGSQIAEAVRIYKKKSRKEAKKRAVHIMEMVGIPSPQKRYKQYPHQFSGGMQQRIMIAMALAYNPSLLIADEPTTSLDVTIQAQILDLLKDLTLAFKTSLLLITHDLGIAAEMCDKVAVMYAGRIVEQGQIDDVFDHPGHPYTKSLLEAISIDELKPIPGSVPEFSNLPSGCAFHPRCPSAIDICRYASPEMKNGVRCHLWE